MVPSNCYRNLVENHLHPKGKDRVESNSCFLCLLYPGSQYLSASSLSKSGLIVVRLSVGIVAEKHFEEEVELPLWRCSMESLCRAT